MHSSLKPVDTIMRAAYLVIYFGAGIWALFFVDAYSSSLTLSSVEPQGRGELQILGAAYCTTASVFLVQWIKKRGSTIYLNPMIVLTATLLSRLVSILKGDINQMLIVLLFFEVVFAIWAFWFGKSLLPKIIRR